MWSRSARVVSGSSAARPWPAARPERSRRSAPQRLQKFASPRLIASQPGQGVDNLDPHMSQKREPGGLRCPQGAGRPVQASPPSPFMTTPFRVPVSTRSSRRVDGGVSSASSVTPSRSEGSRRAASAGGCESCRGPQPRSYDQTGEPFRRPRQTRSRRPPPPPVRGGSQGFVVRNRRECGNCNATEARTVTTWIHSPSSYSADVSATNNC